LHLWCISDDIAGLIACIFGAFQKT